MPVDMLRDETYRAEELCLVAIISIDELAVALSVES